MSKVSSRIYLSVKYIDLNVRDEALLESERLKTQELLKPLQNELAELEEQIADQQSKISSLKSSISRNDENIQKVLKLVATA